MLFLKIVDYIETQLQEHQGKEKDFQYSHMRRSHKENKSTMEGYSRVNIGHLPPDVLTLIFKGLHIRDLLSIQQVCRLFHGVSDCFAVWKHASFFRSWPTTHGNLQVFHKAAMNDNLEAMVKLAFAKLYNIGLSEDEKMLSMEVSAVHAATYFRWAEDLSTRSFSWVFLRPPWSSPCCKYHIFRMMALWAEDHMSQRSRGLMALNVAHTLTYMDNNNWKQAAVYFQRAAQYGIREAQLMKWLYKYENNGGMPAEMLESVRELRGLVNEKSENWSNLMLCQSYLHGHRGGFSLKQACTFTQRVVQSFKPVYVLPVLSTPHFSSTSKVRYILVEWLVEVATNLNMTTATLLNTVLIVDRCLLARSFHKRELQLLGIAALVICTRCRETFIMTVKEAAWYTDNTYTYEEVVEMMSEIVAILKGNLRQMTNYDLVHVLGPVTSLGDLGLNLVDYILEQCMLHAYMTIFPPAHIAASSVVLAHILMTASVPWTSKMDMWTGLTLADLIPCILELHKCFSEDIPEDEDSPPTQAVKVRFTGEYRICDIPEIKVVSYTEVKELLSMKYDVDHLVRTSWQLRRVQEYMCPPGQINLFITRSTDALRPTRDDAATPPMELNTSGYDGDILNSSGYEGDILNSSAYDGDNDYDSDPFDLNESCSSDTDGEPRTDPISEPDVHMDMSNCGPPSLISGCSQAALSSPYHVKVNLSNFSFSTSTSSGSTRLSRSAGSSPFLHAGSQSFHSVASSQPALICAVQDDNLSTGFSCTEDVFSDMSDDDDCTGEGAVSLKYPVVESSACGKNRPEDVENLEDSFDQEPGDYGELNEAFCEHDEDHADADLPLPVPVSESTPPETLAKDCQQTGLSRSGSLPTAAVPQDCQPTGPTSSDSLPPAITVPNEDWKQTGLSSVGNRQQLSVDFDQTAEVSDHFYTHTQAASPSCMTKYAHMFSKSASQQRGEGDDVMGGGCSISLDDGQHGYHVAPGNSRQSQSFVVHEQEKGEQSSSGTLQPIVKHSEESPCGTLQSVVKHGEEESTLQSVVKHSEGQCGTLQSVIKHSEGQCGTLQSVVKHSEGQCGTSQSVVKHSEGQCGTLQSVVKHSEGQCGTSQSVVKHSEGQCGTLQSVVKHSEGQCGTSQFVVKHSEGQCGTSQSVVKHSEGQCGTLQSVVKHSEGVKMAGRRLSPQAHGTSLLGHPVVQLYTSEHGHCELLVGDDHTAPGQQSLCSSALQFDGKSTSHRDNRQHTNSDQTDGRQHINADPVDSKQHMDGDHKVFSVSEKTQSPGKNCPVIPHGRSVIQEVEMSEGLSRATKRKSPSSLTGLSSPRSAQTKRLRRHTPS